MYLTLIVTFGIYLTFITIFITLLEKYLTQKLALVCSKNPFTRGINRFGNEESKKKFSEKYFSDVKILEYTFIVTLKIII